MSITQTNLKVGERTIDDIYYINESMLRCAFQREYNKVNNDYVEFVFAYDDFADEPNKWYITEHHYNTNGEFIEIRNEQTLTDNERNEIKAFIIDWFNRNYDISLLLDNDTDNDREYIEKLEW